MPELKIFERCRKVLVVAGGVDLGYNRRRVGFGINQLTDKVIMVAFDMVDDPGLGRNENRVLSEP